MKALARVLRTSVARAIAAMCAAAFVTTAPAALAGINVWTSHGPPDGEIHALAIDPVTPRTLYAGTNDAGVFKSIDAGATWDAAGAGLPNPNNDYIVSTLSIDPITSSTLYAATGTCSDVGCSGGVFKSTDAGATWSATDLTTYVMELVTDPINPQILYAGTYYDGVAKSTDAGVTWNAGFVGTVFAVAIDPITPQTLYTGTGGSVFKSTDASATWGSASAGLIGTGVSALAIDPIMPQTLYAGTYGGGVFKSTDAAATWSAANAELPNRENNYYFAVSALAIDPITPQTLYAGYPYLGGGVFKSTDGGSTWKDLNTGLTNTRVYVLAIDPMEPRRVYAGTSGGGVFAIEQMPPSCVGDCEGADTVAIDDIITLVNIALGTTAPSACPNGGLPLGGEVDVAVILQAVNNALNGCRVGA